MSNEIKSDGRDSAQAVADRYAEGIRGLADLCAAINNLNQRGLTVDRKNLWGALCLVLEGQPDRRRTVALGEWDGLPDSIESSSDLVTAWLDSQLEVYIDRRYSLTTGGYSTTSVGVLLGFGGPTVRLTTNGSDELTINAQWWGDSASRWAYWPELSACLDETDEILSFDSQGSAQ